MSIPDTSMMTYFRLLTRHHADELERMESDLAAGVVNPRDLKARLAREIIARLRGAAAAPAAEEHFDRVFRRHEAAADLQELALEPADERGRPRVTCRPSWSAGSARRARSGGGASSRVASRSTASRSSDARRPAAQLLGRRVKAGKSARFQGLVRGRRPHA